MEREIRLIMGNKLKKLGIISVVVLFVVLWLLLAAPLFIITITLTNLDEYYSKIDNEL